MSGQLGDIEGRQPDTEQLFSSALTGADDLRLGMALPAVGRSCDVIGRSRQSQRGSNRSPTVTS